MTSDARPDGSADRGDPVSRDPVRVLVVVASRHGATAEIAAALATGIRESASGQATGIAAVAVPVEHRPDPGAFDAVVLGSAVYAGRWLEPAREYAATHAGLLRRRPTWLFSSGPIGEPPFPPDEPHDIPPLTEVTRARGHALFPGRLDKGRLGFAERAMVTAMRAPVGDFRDWAAVQEWAESIADQLATPTRTVPVET